MSVDPKGLEAAKEAARQSWQSSDMSWETALERGVEAYLAATSPAGDLVEWVDVLAKQLTSMAVAGCTCDTKSPTLEFHAVNCKYRQASEALDTLDEIREAAQALRYQSTGVTEITDEMVDAAHATIEASFRTEPWEFGPPSTLARQALTAALSAQERG